MINRKRQRHFSCYTILFLVLFLTPHWLFSQGVLFQNTGGDTLVYIADEGTTGSLKLKPGVVPSITTDKLYNVGGSLHWGDSPLSHMWNKNGSHVYYNDGKVGIGEMSPTADLEVNGIDGVVFKGTYGSGTIPATGAGARMMWYPKNSAFRVGSVDGTQWDDTNIGFGSFAAGDNNIASGNFSFVGGVGNNAGGGFYSTAIGGYNSAFGNGSVAIGLRAEAIGHPAFAIGQDVSATGNWATAFGTGTNASGNFSTAIGRNTISSGNNSISMGVGIEAEGDYAFAIGLSNQTATIVSQANTMAIMGGKVGINTTSPGENLVVKMGGTTWADPHFALENSATTDKWDMTIGNNKRLFLGYNEDSKVVVDTMGKMGVGIVSPSGDLHVSGEDGVLFEGTYESGEIPKEGAGTRMMWYPKKAAFRAGIVDALQWNSSEIGKYSFATGNNTRAKGWGSVAMGNSTFAFGPNSFAMGYNTTTIGGSSIALGYETTATGQNSTAIGFGIEASGSRTIAIALDDQTGTNVSQSNTMAIMGGKVGIGDISPEATLEIHSSGTTEDPLRVRIGSATKLRVWASNGSISMGTNVVGPENGLLVRGNIVPRYHRNVDLGTDSTAWDDIYYDDLHNMGTSAFDGRVLTNELIEFPPLPKKPGSFDYLTDRGDVELDPGSMPPGLADKNSLLTDEIASFNYKANYEQQLEIKKLIKQVKQLEIRLAKLEKLLKK
ncbi:MAG: hypothetical protein HKN68_12930 [Saprospiraceae bacterium]|nr:hypothetical protein [Saprospiraceae bacterium]